jgi:hypothetical protein
MSADFADPDIELMLRFQKGEERCFEELVGKHTRGVLNLVFATSATPPAPRTGSDTS